MQVEQVDLREIVQRAVESVRPLINERSHELSISLPSDPVWLQADITRIEQVIVNLLNNAAKYTDKGGQISLDVNQEGNFAVLRVRDNGTGIAPELLDNIFDLFSQAKRTLDRAQGGLGIGLTLVQKIVDLHHGRVEARSAGSGQGSEFTIWLPVAGTKAAQESVSAGIRDSIARGVRILLVDDNLDAADMFATVLGLLGHEVQTAYSGESALIRAKEFHPVIVLLDIGLPEMDGYEVARRLRQQPQTKDAWLIAMTGYGQDTDRSRSQEAGFDHHLVKPVDAEELEQLIIKLSSKSRS
jgi:CheY-like chemotaxis protein